jgi:hypothetical protein
VLSKLLNDHRWVLRQDFLSILKSNNGDGKVTIYIWYTNQPPINKIKLIENVFLSSIISFMKLNVKLFSVCRQSILDFLFGLLV